jgi:hypothetical protein
LIIRKVTKFTIFGLYNTYDLCGVFVYVVLLAANNLNLYARTYYPSLGFGQVTGSDDLSVINMSLELWTGGDCLIPQKITLTTTIRGSSAVCKGDSSEVFFNIKLGFNT